MSQLNFFMTKEEMISEVNQLILSRDFTVLDERSFDSQTPKAISKLNIDSSRGITIWINNPIGLPNCSLKGEGSFEGKFLFDIYKDPIIELDFGKEESKLFTPSRLFYKAGLIENKELRDLHSKLANHIVMRFKKKLTTTSHLKPFYISNALLEFLSDGYELELGQGGLRVNKDKLLGT